MDSQIQEGKLTRRDVATARALRAAPWLGFFGAALPFPTLFFLLYVFSTEGAAFYMLMTLTSLGFGALIGFIIALFLFFYRKRWEKSLRDRLAIDGITADEIPFFTPELKTAERVALRRIETQSPALADAYRETLAARLTATRLLATAKRELVRIDSRLARARQIRNADTQSLEADLLADQKQLEELKTTVSMHLDQAETQLQTIEATSSRHAIRSGTDVAIQRLQSTGEQPPLALEAARMEEAARVQVQNMIQATPFEQDTKS